MITVQNVIEIRKINKILDKIEFCKKNTTKEEIKLFVNYRQALWDDACGAHLDTWD